jgi:hypothetical protein
VAVHYDKGQGALRMARWNGSGFSGEVVYDGEIVTNADGSTVAGDAGAYAKLRFGADGTAYVAFYDVALSALRLATRAGTAWTVEVVDDTGDVGTWPDLSLDGSTVTIAYADRANGDLKLATGRPGSWSLEVVDAGDTVGEDVVLLPDGAGILYMDGVNADMKVARRSGAAWALDVVTGADGARGFHNEAVKIGGRTYVGCYDFTAKSIWFSALPT